jgi:glycogen phosphorylase
VKTWDFRPNLPIIDRRAINMNIIRAHSQVHSLKRPVAYFSMEYGLKNNLPIYSGGLGILAGDTLKSAADMGHKMVAVGLLYREGYHTQELVRGIGQIPHSVEWDPEKVDGLTQLNKSVKVQIEGREVAFKLWKYDVVGKTGHSVPLILLDSFCPENDKLDGFKKITSRLYNNPDPWCKITQEMALGIGGMRALQLLYPGQDFSYHLNEGHAAMAPVEYLMNRYPKSDPWQLNGQEYDDVASHFTCTTHTPVPAGHDRFYIENKLDYIVPSTQLDFMKRFGTDPDNNGMINMSILMMNLSRKINAVARLHFEVTKKMFPQFAQKMTYITNGIHSYTWVAPSMAAVFDKFCPKWENDPTALSELASLCTNSKFRDSLWKAHMDSKKQLINEVNRRHPWLAMDENAFTIGFARRAAGYKRADLMFTDLDKLIDIANGAAERYGKVQILIAGKAHYEDGTGAEIIKNLLARMSDANAKGNGNIKVVYLENHDMDLGKLMVSGSDVWLNTPLPPFEASGTSGMKAALNGNMQVSTLDGWWPEGFHDGKTGWKFGAAAKLNQNPNDKRYTEDSAELYLVLEEVSRMYYVQKDWWKDMMINAISLNGSYFNTHRMLNEYIAMWNSGAEKIG